MNLNNGFKLFSKISAFALVCIITATGTLSGLAVESTSFQFDHDLYYGLSEPDVMRLQSELKLAGCFDVEPTGYFGSVTRQAVLCFQNKNKFNPIPATGYVGPYTRQSLNKIIVERDAVSKSSVGANEAEPPDAPTPVSGEVVVSPSKEPAPDMSNPSKDQSTQNNPEPIQPPPTAAPDKTLPPSASPVAPSPVDQPISTPPIAPVEPPATEQVVSPVSSDPVPPSPTNDGARSSIMVGLLAIILCAGLSVAIVVLIIKNRDRGRDHEDIVEGAGSDAQATGEKKRRLAIVIAIMASVLVLAAVVAFISLRGYFISKSIPLADQTSPASNGININLSNVSYSISPMVVLAMVVLLGLIALAVYVLIARPKFFFSRNQVVRTELVATTPEKTVEIKTPATANDFKSSYVTPESISANAGKAPLTQPARKPFNLKDYFSAHEKPAAAISATPLKKIIKIKSWKTIGLGERIDVASITVMPRENSFGLGDFYALIDREAVISYPAGTQISLVAPSVAELGFQSAASYGDILNAAKNAGLTNCPARAVLQLRSEYSEQPDGEILLIGMDPVMNSIGGFYIFSLESQGGQRSLTSVDGNTSKTYPLEQRVVFVQSRVGAGLA